MTVTSKRGHRRRKAAPITTITTGTTKPNRPSMTTRIPKLLVVYLMEIKLKELAISRPEEVHLILTRRYSRLRISSCEPSDWFSGITWKSKPNERGRKRA